MTKEEVIIAHWIDLNFEPSQLDENGFIDFDFLPDDFDMGNIEVVRLGNNFENLFARPKSLKGIEDNNSWVKIESEADLPKESGRYFIIENGKISFGVYNPNYIKWVCDGQYYYENNNIITHYQPIIKPELPIY